MNREESQALAGLIAMFAITAAWWALALWPVADGPTWLERTRYVCFGATENGLPDTGGWIGLIAGPLGMLSILLIGWRRGVEGLLRRSRRSRPLAAALALLAIGTMAMVTGAASRVQQANAATVGDGVADAVPATTYPRLDRPAPPLVLISQDGAAIDLADLHGRPVLVTFAYAHCTTVCPVIVSHVIRARERLQGTVDEPAVMIVTLDPWRDPPSRLPAMAAAWALPAADAWVLSGAIDDVETVLDAWDVPRSRDLTSGEITHPSLAWVIGRDGRIAYASTGGVDALVSLVQRLGP